ncbi:MAG TPA: hypothetical protein VNT80_04640 [Acidimicrobiales bacterium]|nr:hypothetical protein [Acidimicrobiales bacterium]
MRSRPRTPARGVAVIVVALGLACLGLPTTSAFSAPTTTTTSTLPTTVVLAGNAYARHLIAAQPIPPQARRVAALPTPLPPNGDIGESPLVRQDHHFYLLPMSVSVDQFVRSHLPRGETVTETGSGTSRNALPTYNLGLSLTCVSPHVTFCGVYYQTTEAKNGEQELRIDVQVVYLPIVHATMPTDGVATVTGYGTISLMNPSSNPSSVVLTHHQALTLATVVAQLKDYGNTGFCAEDSQLLKITIVKDGTVLWSATADECPGVLQITSVKSSQALDDRSCAFWHVADSFFSPGTANGTKSGSQFCQDTQG